MHYGHYKSALTACCVSKYRRQWTPIWAQVTCKECLRRKPKTPESSTGRVTAEPAMQWIPVGPLHEWHDTLLQALEQSPRLVGPLLDCDLSAAEALVRAYYGSR